VRAYIQSVPTRAEYVQERMFPALDEQESISEIRVFTDHDRNGPLWNAMRIWRDILERGEPGLALQDDVILHPDFGTGFPEIVKHITSGRMNAVSLFAPPRKQIKEWFESGYNFVENYKFLWAQALVLTPQFVEGLLGFAAGQSTRHDDTVLGEYSQLSGMAIWNCLPSLVQHDLEVKSAMGTGVSCGGIRRETVVWEQTVPEGTYASINSIRYGRAK
jgi:hypothetical protein